MPDYYEILGVSRNVSPNEVRQAYRRLAREHHPDVNPGQQDAEERFKEINSAYEVLSDPEKRRNYDRYGENWKYADRIEEAQAARGRGSPFTFTSRDDLGGVFNFGSGPSEDLLEHLITRERRPRRRSAARVPVKLSLEEALTGATRLVELPDAGLGAVRRLEVKIPAGVDTGSSVHIPAGGDSGQELYLVVSVNPDPRFQRKGRDLYTEVEVPLVDVALGAEVTVPTLQGKLALNLPPETQNGQTFRLSGQGMPSLTGKGSRGQLYVTVKVVLPVGLNEEERELFRELKGIRSGRGGI